ncbi:divalent metal cation transporter [Candidatus Peregrinibacteria bacterium]|nr:divalent metal cation transporter [Candidatus Peregrinibacteria bacterium]
MDSPPPSRWRSFKTKFLLLLSVVGPGIVSGTADNDAGGITTYSVVGASFGYRMLWILFIITLILALTQEMGARLGLVTGKGLAALIRENFRLRTTTFLIVASFVVNLGIILAEYAGVIWVADIYGVPHWVAVLLAACTIWLVVRKGSFKSVQKVFLTSSFLFFAYLITGTLVKPDWTEALRETLIPSIVWSKEYFYTAAALIGTTITAWGQFFIQSYFVDKGVTAEHLKYSRWDVFMGAFWTDFVAYFIILATAGTLYKAGIHIETAAQAAIALQPLAGAFAKHLFAWGLLNASLLGLAVVSMTSAYIVTEAFGWEGRVDLKQESPSFYRIFTFCIFFSALVILIPGLPLVRILVGPQILNTFILPILFIAILRLLNNSRLMGEHKNGRVLNIISWVSVFFLVAMAGATTFMLIFGSV